MPTTPSPGADRHQRRLRADARAAAAPESGAGDGDRARPSFDVAAWYRCTSRSGCSERAKWLEDLRPYLANPQLTAPDFDFADFGAGRCETATQPDGRMDVAAAQSAISGSSSTTRRCFTEKGFGVPDEHAMRCSPCARTLTDKSKGIYGFVGRGLKNANVPVWTQLRCSARISATVTPDGKTLADRHAGCDLRRRSCIRSIMRECAPPGSIGFNWNECQTSFIAGQDRRCGWTASASRRRSIDPKQVEGRDKVGFAVVPEGAEGAALARASSMRWASRSAEQEQGRRLPLHASGRPASRCMAEILRTGSRHAGAAQRLYRPGCGEGQHVRPQEWLDTRDGRARRSLAPACPRSCRSPSSATRSASR